MAPPKSMKRRSQHFHEPGVRGRATGAYAKTNVKKGEANLDNVDDFFDSDVSHLDETMASVADFEEEPTPVPKPATSAAAAASAAGLPSPSPVQGSPGAVASPDLDATFMAPHATADANADVADGDGDVADANADGDADGDADMPGASLRSSPRRQAAAAMPTASAAAAAAAAPQTSPRSRLRLQTASRPSPLANMASSTPIQSTPVKKLSFTPEASPVLLSGARSGVRQRSGLGTARGVDTLSSPVAATRHTTAKRPAEPHAAEAAAVETTAAPEPAAVGSPGDARSPSPGVASDASASPSPSPSPVPAKKSKRAQPAAKRGKGRAIGANGTSKAPAKSPAKAKGKAKGNAKTTTAAAAAAAGARVSPKAAAGKRHLRRQLTHVESDSDAEEEEEEEEEEEAEQSAAVSAGRAAALAASDSDSSGSGDAYGDSYEGGRNNDEDDADGGAGEEGSAFDQTVYLHGRPQRKRFKPVKFWKGERPIYKQQVKEGKRTGLFVLKDVLTVETPEDVHKPARKTGKKDVVAAKATKGRKPKATAAAAAAAEEVDTSLATGAASPPPPGASQSASPAASTTASPRQAEGAAASTPLAPAASAASTASAAAPVHVIQDDLDEQVLATPEVTVRDWKKEDELISIAAIKTHGMCNWRSLQNDQVRFCKSFSLQTARWSTGQLELEPGARKGEQSTRLNFLVFTVTRGLVEVKIHETTSVVGTGASFYVPPNNTYDLYNAGDYTSRIFFVQIKEPGAE